MEIRLNLLFICIFCFCQHGAVRPSQNAAIVTNKMMHKNGLKEFTVLKQIKGNDCACACLCTSPDSVDGMAELHRIALPGNQTLDRLIRPPIRYFQIAKEIRANQCKCSCACTEPHDEVVMEFNHNSDHEQHQVNNDVVSENWTSSPKRTDDEQRSTTLESDQTVPITSSSSSNTRKTLRDSEDIQMQSTTTAHLFQNTTKQHFVPDTTVDSNNVTTVSEDSSTVHIKETQSTESRSTPSISDGSSKQIQSSTESRITSSISDDLTKANHSQLFTQSHKTPSFSLGSSTVSPSRNTPLSASDDSSKVEELPTHKILSTSLGSSTVQESSSQSPTTPSISINSSTVEEIHVFTIPKTATTEQGGQNVTIPPSSTMKNTLKIASGNDDGMKTKAGNATILDSAPNTNSKATPTIINMTEFTVRQQTTELLNATVSSPKAEMVPSTATFIVNSNSERQLGITNTSSTNQLPSKGFEITKNESNIGTNSFETTSKIPIFEVPDSSNNNTVSSVLATTNLSSNFNSTPLPILEKQQQKSNFSATILPTTGFKIAKNATQSSPLPTVPSKMSIVLSKQHIVTATASTTTVSDNIMNTVSTTTVATTEPDTIQNTIPTTATNTVSVTMKNLREILLGKELPSPSPTEIGDDKQQNSTISSTTAPTTLDPAFKARVANMLNKLKEQLYRLREEEKRKKVVNELEQEHKTNQEQLEKMAETQRTTLATIILNSGTVTNVSKERLSDYGTISNNISSIALNNANNTENSKLFTTEFANTTIIPDKNDTVPSKIKEDTVSPKEKQHVDSKSNAKSTIAPMDMSIDGKAEQMLQQHRQVTTIMPKTVIVTVTRTTVPDNVSSGFAIENGSNSAEDEEDEKGQLGENSTKNSGNTIKLAENRENSTGKVGTEKEDKENSTTKMETTEITTTLSTAFKARVANLLNRLKEQLYKMRELQEAMKEPSNSTVTVEQSTVTVPTVSTTVNRSLSSTMIVLEGLQKKMEKENDSKITKNSTIEPKNSLVDSSNEEAPGFITEAPEMEMTSTEIQANSTTNAANISQNLANPTISTVNAQINQSMDNHINESKNTVNDPSDNKLFPLSSDFSQSEDRRNRIILLPPPPQGSALFSSSPAANESTNTSKDILSSESNFTDAENPHVGLQNAIEQQTTTFTENINDVSTTNMPPKMGVVSTTTMSTTIIVGGATRKVPQAIPLTPLAPLAQSMIERLEMARKLREEQVKLEMMEAIRREQLGTDEIDPHLEERRREIEAKLLLLAQTERFHRELLERQQNEQQREATRSKSSDDQQNTAATVSENAQTEQRTDQYPSAVNVDALCDPVRRFLHQFRVDDPRRWMARNCRVARRHFPHASCGQIGVLLAKCVEQQNQQHRANIQNDSEEEGEEERI